MPALGTCRCRRVAVSLFLLLIGPKLLLVGQQIPDCLKRTLVVNVRDRFDFDDDSSARDRDRLRAVLDCAYDEMAHFYEVEVELPSSL